MNNKIKIPDSYEIIQTRSLSDICSEGVLLRHKKTGARVALVINEDVNKVFNIAFRTPPADSTGVAHIIEHTVLCGSKKFPVKDPFMELAKGSLNTFLNAMTFPDKTMYPVASCNDKDFKNLTEVYLDAVFYPNIYNTELIFRQEGWRYDLEDKNAPLTVNGVVYNEMKGAFSSADEILDRGVFSALFPDNPYGVESGGDPDYIPTLTYEAYLDFHRKYYHPSNCYIYLYGKMDFYERLDFIDREYLSRFDAHGVDSGIALQKPFKERKNIEMPFPVIGDEELIENTYLNMSAVVSDSGDILKNMAFSVLEYVLLDAPGAPVKQALLEAGIGKDAGGSFQGGLRQNFFSIDVKFASPADTGRFSSVIKKTLEELVENGLDEKALRAAIHFFEFRYREADFGPYPKGLIYGMSMMDTWLYDDEKPFDYLERLKVFDELKKRVGTGYFEELIKTGLLENPHCVVVTMNPEKGLLEKKEAALNKKLEDLKASMTKEEISEIIAGRRALALFQEQEDSKEATDTIPRLLRDDIDKKNPFEMRTKETSAGNIGILSHDYETNGIAYLTLLFDAGDIPEELVPYMSLLKSMLGYVSTENYGYGDLFNEINSRTGGINCGLTVVPLPDGGDRRFFGIKAKYLYPEQDFIFDMITEILKRTRFDDDRRIYEIIAGQKSMFQEQLASEGHVTGVQRALYGSSSANCFQEQIAGVMYYRFLEELFADYEGKKEELKRNFALLMNHLFRKEKLTVDITAAPEVPDGLKNSAAAFADGLYTGETQEMSYTFTPSSRKEAFKTSGQVQFVATAGNFREKGYEYSGALAVISKILSRDYLWTNIRVKGGAYGCFSAFMRNGDSYLSSFRDPNLVETLRTYEGIGEYLRNFSAGEDEMTKYIIGTIGSVDAPKTASASGALALSAYLGGLTNEMLQKSRDEILSCGEETIRSFADMLEDTFDMTRICVVGSESALKENEELFDATENLVNA